MLFESIKECVSESKNVRHRPIDGVAKERKVKCLPKHKRTDKANIMRKGSPKHERTDKANMKEKLFS